MRSDDCKVQTHNMRLILLKFTVTCNVLSSISSLLSDYVNHIYTAKRKRIYFYSFSLSSFRRERATKKFARKLQCQPETIITQINICSNNVYTCRYRHIQALLYMYVHVYICTLSRSWNRWGSQFAWHHLSIWPAMCNLSMTISTDASFWAVTVISRRLRCLANFRRWQPSS